MPKVPEPVPCITLDVLHTPAALQRERDTTALVLLRCDFIQPQTWAVAHLPVFPHAQFPKSVERQVPFGTRKQRSTDIAMLCQHYKPEAGWIKKKT